MNTWEAIFSQSPVNEGYYNEHGLPQNHWDWPRGTWFQSRLDHIRDHAAGGNLKSTKKFKEPANLRTMLVPRARRIDRPARAISDD